MNHHQPSSPVNFIVTTGWFFPVRIEGISASTVFRAQKHPDAQALPHSKRAASCQSISCQDFFKSLTLLSQHAWLPSHIKPGCVSLKRLGFKGVIKGLSPRPALPNQMATMRFIRKYIDDLDGSSRLFASLDTVPIACDFVVPPHVCEPSDRDRFLSYQKFHQRIHRMKKREKKSG